jgi:hypothetical protein
VSRSGTAVLALAAAGPALKHGPRPGSRLVLVPVAGTGRRRPWDGLGERGGEPDRQAGEGEERGRERAETGKH